MARFFLQQMFLIQLRMKISCLTVTLQQQTEFPTEIVTLLRGRKRSKANPQYQQNQMDSYSVSL